jgi:hypothetical protein
VAAVFVTMAGFKNLFNRNKSVDVGRGNPSATPLTASQPLSKADVYHKRVKGQKVTAAEIRELRELIRQRYAKDIEIYSKRDVLPASRKIIEHWLVQADALMIKINAIIDDMDSEKLFENEEDWKKFCEIKRRIRAPGKREWCKEKPWS